MWKENKMKMEKMKMMTNKRKKYYNNKKKNQRKFQMSIIKLIYL